MFHRLLVSAALLLSVGQAPAAGQQTRDTANPGNASRALQHLDLDPQSNRQIIVDRTAGQYLGHPTTCLLEDGKTILCVYPKGHGKGEIVYKRSGDGGVTWSEPLPTPASWKTSKEVPTLHRTVGPDGAKRIIMFSGLYPVRLAISEDDGESWGELQKVGDWGGIVVMSSVFPLETGPGHYMGMFHDDGQYFSSQPMPQNPPEFALYKSTSADGGLTWSDPLVVHKSASKQICEPGVIRSPDKRRLACLLRENGRRYNSQIIFSGDEGRTWTAPRDLPDSLNGDRHVGKYGPDGRMLISFRRRSPEGIESEFEGDWVAWVGTYEDLVNQAAGQYVVRLKDNKNRWDCAYSGLEVLPDGTFAITSYGHWEADQEPYILCVRLELGELDQMVSGQNESTDK